MADRLAKELDLTRAQKTAVEDILNKTGEKLHEHFMQVKPEVDKIIDEGFAQIKTQLTAPQKMEFEKIRRKFDRRHGPGRGPEQPFLPPPPPH
jgi:Spy/CpxP family protein refolding chaperone